MVIFLFLRHFWATVIPAIAVPLALVGTFAVMYPLGYSVNNLTLMALTIAVGFVVDDAIVMIENIVRYIEKGDTPFEAALKGAGRDRLHHHLDHLLAGRRVHPAAADGRHRRRAVPRIRRHRDRRGDHVGLRLAHAHADDVRALPAPQPARRRNAAGSTRPCEDAFDAMLRGYDRGLRWVLAHQPLALAATIALAILTGWLYVMIPKGLFPEQDTGFVFGQAEARKDISFAAWSSGRPKRHHPEPIRRCRPSWASPAPARFNPRRTRRIFMQLKPYSERDVSAEQIIQRLRPQAARVPGVNALPPGGAGSQFRRSPQPHRNTSTR